MRRSREKNPLFDPKQSACDQSAAGEHLLGGSVSLLQTASNQHTWVLLERCGPRQYRSYAGAPIGVADLEGLVELAIGPLVTVEPAQRALADFYSCQTPIWGVWPARSPEPEFVLAVWTDPGCPAPPPEKVRAAIRIIARALRPRSGESLMNDSRRLTPAA